MRVGDLVVYIDRKVDERWRQPLLYLGSEPTCNPETGPIHWFFITGIGCDWDVHVDDSLFKVISQFQR